ncbi:antitoxin [Agilicoccus flavus]|uniref:antitoxin n=1 Tax=Agilicoccus flavus TaxID=2775968 RepID=UPI001CF6A88F|nr:antitoxin [Agilicoccus flavus]
MRTTVTLGDDVLDAARDLAAAQGRPLGDVLTELARRGLRRDAAAPATRNGIPLLPADLDTPIATSALVAELLDDAP